MPKMQFDLKKIHMLQKILLRIREGEAVQEDIRQHFEEVSIAETLLIEQILMSDSYGIKMEDIERLSDIYPHLYMDVLSEEILVQVTHPQHPIQVFKQENIAFQSCLKQINYLIQSYEVDPNHFQDTEMVDLLKQQVFRLGEFHKHYHRKEKLIFPILERYGHFEPTKIMWRGDDRIRALYLGIKRLVDRLSETNVEHLYEKYKTFEQEFKAMIFQEEAIILPVLLSTFSEKDWYMIAAESSAYGYAMIDVKEDWKSAFTIENQKERQHISSTEDIRFGGGYLTTEEANLILNSLPLEITFVDKNSIFKYFNEMTESADMMLVRTPISIGRNVANCHPPKSLQKVMTVVRDLKTKRRTSESMWYKKQDQYIHITYKALFNGQDEFLGILEYVQNIQPFFDLPSEIKTGLSKIDE